MASRSIARADAAAGLAARLTLGGRFRITARLAMMALAVLVAVPLHYLWRLFRMASPWPRIFLGTVGRICGARVSRVGMPLRGEAFYVSNHLSWIDILAIGGASGSAFVAKAEIGRVPVVGWLCTLNRTLFVSREDRLRVTEQIDQLRDAFADHWSVTVFPEGTTTDGKSLLPFKTSMLKVLEPPPPGVLVQPILLDYGEASEEIAWVGSETGKDNALRILARPGNFRVRVHFLDPLDPHAFPGRKAIAAESRRRMAEALEAANGEPLRPFAD